MSDSKKISVDDFPIARRAKRSSDVESATPAATEVEVHENNTPSPTQEGQGLRQRMKLNVPTAEQRLSNKKAVAIDRADSRRRLADLRKERRREVTTAINVQMSFELKERLDRAKLELNVPIQQIVRFAIEEILKENGL